MKTVRMILMRMFAALIAVAVTAAGGAVVPVGNSSLDAAVGWVARDLGKAGTRSRAVDINEQGHVVGSISTASSGRIALHAFQWADGTMRDLGTLPLGGRADMPNASEAAAINDRGQIVGTSDVDQNDSVFSAVLWTAGKVRELGCPASARMGGASAINGRGQVVGWCGDGPPGRGLPTRAVVWEDGRRRELGSLGGSSASVAINDRGQVVGTSGRHAFLWQNGKMTDLGALQGRHVSEAVGINNRGQVIGLSFSSFDARVAGAYRAVLWQNGQIRDLGTLGGRSSSAVAINERGQIVGASATSSGAEHAFIWQSGRMTDLGTVPRARGSGAVAINERNQVVGASMMRDYTTHAVVWTLR